MKKFKRGDRVQVIEVPEHGKRHLNKTGVAHEPSSGYQDDDVRVVFDAGGFGYFKEDQLEAVD